MSDTTAIEWTDHTFSPWWGCSRISPACAHCYAADQAKRYGHEVWRRHGPRRMLSDANWQRPLKWNRDAECAGVPAKVFCASMADVFEDHPDVEAPRRRLWEVIEATPWLRWQLLTKRPENVAQMAPWGRNWPSWVWLGVSAENQRYADERIPLLLASGAKTLFLSCEPLVGPLDLGLSADHSGHQRDHITDSWGWDCLDCSDEDTETVVSWTVPDGPQVSWVIAGGESGPHARPSHPAWFRSLRDQCVSAGVPFFYKQWGEWSERGNPDWPLGDARKNPQRHCWVSPQSSKTKPFGAFTGNGDQDWAHVKRVGKKTAGRVLDGREWSEFPRGVAAAISR
jgi:protein gp37